MSYNINEEAEMRKFARMKRYESMGAPIVNSLYSNAGKETGKLAMRLASHNVLSDKKVRRRSSGLNNSNNNNSNSYMQSPPKHHHHNPHPHSHLYNNNINSSVDSYLNNNNNSNNRTKRYSIKYRYPSTTDNNAKSSNSIDPLDRDLESYKSITSEALSSMSATQISKARKKYQKTYSPSQYSTTNLSSSQYNDSLKSRLYSSSNSSNNNRKNKLISTSNSQTLSNKKVDDIDSYKYGSVDYYKAEAASNSSIKESLKLLKKKTKTKRNATSASSSSASSSVTNPRRSSAIKRNSVNSSLPPADTLSLGGSNSLENSMSSLKIISNKIDGHYPRRRYESRHSIDSFSNDNDVLSAENDDTTSVDEQNKDNDGYNMKNSQSVQSMISIGSRRFKWPELRRDGKLRGLVGLRNLGNTCFMNSCLQCICSTPPLIEYMVSGEYSQHINRKSRIRGKLARSFADLVKIFRDGSDGEVERPSDIKRIVSMIAPQFAGFNQHDMQEFLQFLLDGLHDDLNKILKKPKYEEIKDLPNENDFQKSQRWWQNYTSRNDSFISDLFCGQLKSSVKCGSCGNVSTVFDPAWDISVPIPKAKSRIKRMFGVTSSSSITLEDCFRAYTKCESLTGNDQYYCSKCKKHRDCTKSLALYRLPYILIVHLKRFSASHSSFSFHRSKITDRVQFPINGLDLSEFSPNDSEAKYDLYAVANHSGGLGGGHYTAFAKVAPHKWAYLNDSRTQFITNEDRIISSEAYVLFYIRRE